MTYEKFVDKLMTHERHPVTNPSYQRALHSALALNSEAGELANAYIKNFGYNQQLNVANVKEELGDLLFFIQDMCNLYGWSIPELIKGNHEKLLLRYPEGKWNKEAAKKRADKEPPQEKKIDFDDILEDFNNQFDRRLIAYIRGIS